MKIILQEFLIQSKNAKNLHHIFSGAIEIMKKKVTANYKIAVPQYFNGKNTITTAIMFSRFRYSRFSISCNQKINLGTSIKDIHA